LQHNLRLRKGPNKRVPDGVRHCNRLALVSMGMPLPPERPKAGHLSRPVAASHSFARQLPGNRLFPPMLRRL